MSTKIKSVLIPVLLILVIATSFTVSLTLGRYSAELGSESIYTGEMEYVVSNQVEIESVNEFFTAVENGYSNIKIADGVDNPLVISGGVSDVNSDLVIDLNGHELQRNNREPLLNITQGVRMTVIDTSEAQTGSFYNPVGSVLRISGGTLTVSAGLFESGPRSGAAEGSESEYAALQADGSYKTPKGAKTISQTVGTLYDENETPLSASMPVIEPYKQEVSADGETHYSVNGNMYFSEGYNDNTYIPADTYLYFTLNDATVENATISAEGSADYYYTYYLNRGTFEYAGDQSGNDENTVMITVYVYQNVKGAANKDTRFSSIGMKSGNLYVRGGTYHSYFGEEDTYCVDASGGYMSIESGEFFAYGDSVCVECAYARGTNVEDEYLSITDGAFYSEIGNTVSVTRGRMVVSQAAFTKNAVSGGAVSARNQNGSAIYVSGGSLNVSSASSIGFSLYGSGMSGITATDSGASVSVENVEMNFYSGQSAGADQTSPAGISFNTGIYAEGGTVTCSGTTAFRVIGSYSSGIYSKGGTINLNGDTFNCSVKMAEDGEFGKELSSTAISTVGGNINFNVKEATVSSNGLGITVGGGNITFEHGSSSAIDIKTSRGSAIYVYDGKIDIDKNSTVNIVSRIDPSCSWAVDTSGDYTGITNTDVNINNGVYVNGGSFKSDGNIIITHTGINNNEGTAGKNDSKIKSYAVRVDGQLSSGTSTFDAEYLNISVLNNGGGLYVNQGTITLDTAVINSQGYGIAMRGESETDSVTIKKSLTITSARTTGIYITGGSLTLNGETTVNSTINANYQFCTGSNLPKNSYDGVFVENGSLYANGTFNVKHEGIDSTAPTNIPDGSYAFLHHEIKTYAVRVTELGSDRATNVNISKGMIQNTIGGGVFVSGGTVELGSRGDDNGNLIVMTRGEELLPDSYSVHSSAPNWVYSLSKSGGNAIEVQGGSLTVNSGTYTAMQGNGILVRNTESSAVSNKVTINGGNFYGYNSGYNLGDNDRKVGPGASAGLYVMGHSLTVNINGGTFGNKDSNAESNSAAVFFGTPGGERAQVNIFGGNFYGSKSDVLSVFRYVNFVFDASNTTTPIMVENANGNASAALSVQDDLIYNTSNYSDRGSTIDIRNGNFIATGAGIYYGSSVDKLLVSGGTYEGNEDYAINFAYDPGDTQVKLSGGVFKRKNTSIWDVLGGKGYPGNNENNVLESGCVLNKGRGEWTVVRS